MSNKKCSPIWSIPEQDLRNAISTSETFKEAAAKLGIALYATRYKTFKNKIESHNIDVTHILNRPKNYTLGKFDLVAFENHLTLNSKINLATLKKKLIQTGMIEHKCQECSLGSEWNGKKLSLHLDHKNGINTDNRLDNLRFLCPNCHSQTETYCRAKTAKFKICIHCDKRAYNGTLRCLDCKDIPTEREKQYHLSRRTITRPDITILRKEVETLGYCALGRKYGVSDNTIRKWLK